MDLEAYKKNKNENHIDYKNRLREEFNNQMTYTKFNGKNVVTNIEKMTSEYDAFDHITSTSKGEDREYDYERAKYILNIPNLIRNVESSKEIITFKDGDRDIIYNIENGNDFMIVLKDFSYYYLLITAYKVNRKNSRDYYYSEKITELNNLEYSHCYNFTKVYRLKTKIKEIYIDEVIKTWVEDFYTQDIIFRIIATAINSPKDKIIFIVYKNRYHIPSEEKKYTYIISKYANTFSDRNLLWVMKKIEKALETLRRVYESNVNNNLKLIRLIIYNESLIIRMAKKFGKRNSIKKCMRLIEGELGYFATSNCKYKFKIQFPDILKELLSRDKDRIKKVYDKYNVEYDNDIIVKDKYLEKYYQKYFRKYFIDFSNTIYGTDYE